MGSGAECSRMRSWWWKWVIDWSPPWARRLTRFGPRMTTHATTMMITSTTGTNSSTDYCRDKRYRRRIPQWWMLPVTVDSHR